MLKVGERVVRGPNWRYDTQDCDKYGTPTVGTIISADFYYRIMWDNGHSNTYDDNDVIFFQDYAIPKIERKTGIHEHIQWK